MKVDYCSDIHMDFHVPFIYNQLKWENRTRKFITNIIEQKENPSDIVAIAGDISHYNQQSYWVIDTFAKCYKHVLVTLGNHDYYLISKNQQNKYKSSVNRVMELINNFKGTNVYINNPLVSIQGIGVQLLPMWYPIETLEQETFFYNISNDSKYIKGIDIHNEYLEQREQVINGIDLLVTHTPVIQVPSHLQFGGTACYLAPVDVLPKNVIMGHTHEHLNIIKYGTQFVMNCWGYENYGFKIETMELLQWAGTAPHYIECYRSDLAVFSKM